MVRRFAFSELLARVRTLLRRGKAKEPEVLKAADLELDLLRRRVTRAGRRIELTAKEFALMELLMRRRGEVLPRSLIASQIWDMNFDSDTNVIEVALRRLRGAKQRAYPREQLGKRERFHQVVIRTQLQALDALLDLVARCEK